jgi:undecaprenyl-diphosphatase
MSTIDALFLGILQGFTEFLPISSSGHLVLGEALLGIKSQNIVFEVIVHLATAAAIVLAYRKRIVSIMGSLGLAFSPGAWKRLIPGDSGSEPRRENFLLGLYIVLGTLPAAFFGLLFKKRIEAAFTSPRLVCLMLIITGLILASSRFFPKQSGNQLSWWRVVLIGLAQAFALLPGISRSGTTITAGLLLGLAPGKSAEFSFLLALPAILGAAVVELAPLFPISPETSPNPGILAVGMTAAFFSGLTAIIFLLKALQAGKFDRFAYYLWAVGLAGILIL